MKRECKIIQDLLPNYIENVTAEETNEYIEEHLKNCEDCEKVYFLMKANIEAHSLEEKKEIKYMKKFNKQIRILKFILIAVLIIFIIGITRKTIIMTSLYGNAKKHYDDYMRNYHIITTQYDSTNSISQVETFHKDNIYKAYARMGSTGRFNAEIISYKNGKEEINLLNSGNTKIKSSNIVASYHHYVPILYTDTIFRSLQESFSVSIESVTIDSRECYAIKSKHADYFVEKKTGLIIKEISYASEGVDSTKYYSYEFGTVKDSDIVKPDTTGYEEKSNF